MNRFLSATLLLTFTLSAAAGAVDVGFTNVYAHAECYPSGAGQVYIVSDDPEPMQQADFEQTTEAMFTTGSDGSYKSKTRYWATLQVIPAEGYACIGVVNRLKDNGNYANGDYYVGKSVDDTSPDDSHKNQLMKYNEADNHMMEALCSQESGGLTINLNTMNSLEEVSNSKNFEDPDRIEKARMAARENQKAWPAEPNVKLYVLFEKREPTGIISTPQTDGTPQADGPPFSGAPMYNLSGQRVTPVYKGIVIRNGKKYIIYK